MKMDASGEGSLATIAFRAAMRKLNLGLTGNELDQILNYVDMDNSGDIDWKEFANRFKAQ